jgi:short-subunit dehydrogenase
VVTGASSGIGRSIAIALAQRGYRTVLVARRAHLLDELASELRRFSPSRALPLDLSITDSIGPAMEEVVATEGAPKVLVNCAGVGMFTPFARQSHDDFLAIMRVNFEAAVEMTRVCLPHLLAAGRSGSPARVFNICSMSARVGPEGHAAYAASKGALRSFTEVLQAEHERTHIAFTIVYPGIVRSEYFQKGTMRHLWPLIAHHAISPERVSRAVVNSLERAPPSLYVPTHNRILDWLVAASPRLAAWVVRRGMRASETIAVAGTTEHVPS